MQVSIKWLKDYIDFTQTPEELADMLTMAGVPVENIIDSGKGLEKVITGRIDKITPHENSDHLQICTINIGTAENSIIVTGAPNVKEGQIVPVAQLGAHLPNGMKIKKEKLRGVTSYGMLCSAQELKLELECLPEEQQTGIFILPADTPIGKPVKDYLGKNDVILEFELTANRGDCFSVIGLVREVAALTGNKPKWPEIKLEEDSAHSINDLFAAQDDIPELCPRYSCRMLENIKVAPSPQWMQDRLAGAGINSINNVVDVTNFVMLELGQPLHAYDYNLLADHKLKVRHGINGEKLRTLNDITHELKEDMIVIADGEKPVGLAGIMGGLATEITSKTTTVVLEAAKFHGPNVRRASRALGVVTEASGRFERNTDVENTISALDRAAQLLVQISGCKVVRDVIDIYPKKAQQTVVQFTTQAVNRHLGTALSAQTMVDILEKLEIKATEKDDSIKAYIPSWRGDITCMQDIAEEVSRIYGFDKIKATLPSGLAMQGNESTRQSFINKLKNIMSSLGLYETVSFAFTHPDMLDKLNIPSDSEIRRAIPIMNPLTDEYPLVRSCLLTSVMSNLVRNFSRKNNDVKIFEVGTVFRAKALPITELPTEKLMLAGALSGNRNPISWNEDAAQIDFYDAKGLVEEVLSCFGIKRCLVESGKHFAMHPGKTAVFKKGLDIIFTVGELHPAVAEAFGISRAIYIFTAEVDLLMKYAAKTLKSKSLPKYPATARDLAILVDIDMPAAQIEKVITKAGGQYLSSVTLFDLYEGKQIEKNNKSLAFSLTFQSSTETLKDVQIDAVFKKIVAALQKDCQATLRS